MNGNAAKKVALVGGVQSVTMCGWNKMTGSDIAFYCFAFCLIAIGATISVLCYGLFWQIRYDIKKGKRPNF